MFVRLYIVNGSHESNDTEFTAIVEATSYEMAIKMFLAQHKDYTLCINADIATGTTLANYRII